jgi:hypothetical protein
MIGELVEHPTYGRGRVTALFRNGSEWLVQFESGLRFRRPRREFNGQDERNGVPAPPPVTTLAPMQRTQYEARQLVEALRVGIAPMQHIQELTIGLNEERANIRSALNQAHQQGGAARAVLGDYGFGKSHIVELVTQEALQRNFVVATVSLDLVELPPHKALDIYGGLLRHLRYPDNDEQGILPLLDRAAALTRVQQQLADLAGVTPDPLNVALQVIKGTASTRQRQAWSEWLMGGRRLPQMNATLPRDIKLPSLYRQGNNARQIAYLLSGISVLARLTNYSGLCLLVDEAESYSLLRSSQQLKADQFFTALIYATLQSQSRIQADTLPQHHRRDYPLVYGGRQSLFFLFTATRSDNRMPLEDWLETDEILELDPHHTAQEIGHFLQQIMTYHAQAYGYIADERQGQIRRGAAELLALGMRNNRLNVRGVVRLSVELFDLLHLHPTYTAVALLGELRALTHVD